jgi:hypothetical protein
VRQLHSVLPGLGTLRLAGQLQTLAAAANDLVQVVDARRPLGRDLVRAAVVRHVRQRTGRFLDEEVAALISVAESMQEIDQDASGSDAQA